jgi:hypothetical protein
VISDKTTGIHPIEIGEARFLDVLSGIIERSVRIIRRDKRVRRQASWVGMFIGAVEKLPANKKSRYLE